MEPEIVAKPAMRFVGPRTSFIHIRSPDANVEKLGELWMRFLPRHESVPGKIGDTCYAVMWALPEEERGHPHELEYMCTVAVEGDSDPPEGMESRDLPATTFAVFLHRGKLESLGATIERVYADWLPSSGYEHSGIADVEVYDARFDPNSDTSEMEYWISVRPVAAD